MRIQQCIACLSAILAGCHAAPNGHEGPEALKAELIQAVGGVSNSMDAWIYLLLTTAASIATSPERVPTQPSPTLTRGSV
jgi:hypothetical protein